MELLFTMLRVILIFLIIFIERKKPGEAVLWVALVFVSPIIGGVLYLIFGSTLGIKITYGLRSSAIYKPYLQILDDQLAQVKGAQPPEGYNDDEMRLVYFNLMYAKGGLGLCNEVDIITNGEDKYQRLFADIAAARHHIHIAYYGIHNDRIGKELATVLTEKAAAGVEVRVLADGIGSFGAKTFLFRNLRKAGGQVQSIKPLLSHFRYHRKIVVIDGVVGYTGGMNIGCKYVSENAKKSPWRDTQIRIEGESVQMLQYYFLYDWLFARRSGTPVHPENAGLLFPPSTVQAKLPCQIIGSGVEDDKQAIKLSYIRMISLAKKRIVLQTPYFIPSASLLDALKIALSSGVEVILQVPARRSNFFLDPTTRYCIAQLVPLGLKVFYYDGYVHAKTVRVDDSITCIGSVNIDIRSLEVDDEICAVFYSEEFGKRYDDILADDIAHSTEMDYRAFTDRGLLKKATERFFLLFSPLM